MTDRQTYRTYLYMRPDIQDLRIYATSRRIKTKDTYHWKRKYLVYMYKPQKDL